MGNKAITERNKDFAKWYTDVVRAAKLCDYSCVKGCMVIEPNGYAIWEKMKEILDKKFKELGHVNVQMPLLIPESMLLLHLNELYDLLAIRILYFLKMVLFLFPI